MPRSRPSPLPFLELPYFNGLGGFTKDGREYAIYLTPGSRTPAPWVNVMANADFGTMVSESGLGFTWRGNSQTNRLTPWHNDPVSDPQSEVIYLRDDDSGACWTPTPRPIRENDAYRARHGQGYTVFEHNSHAIGQELTVFVPLNEDGAGDPVKFAACGCVTIRRAGAASPYCISPNGFWAANREDQQLHIQTVYDAGIRSAVRAGSLGTAAIPVTSRSRRPARALRSYSGDRTAVLGRNRSASKPAALDRMRLDNRAGAGSIRRRRFRSMFRSNAARKIEVIFLLGEAGSVEEARAIISRYQTARASGAGILPRRATRGIRRLGALQVHTPLLVDRFPAESLAALSGAELPLLGALRVVSIQRSLWIPRPVAGFAGLRLCAPRDHARAYSAAAAGNSSRATCSTGGMRKPAWACARAVPTICCGCRSWWRTMLRVTGDAAS